MFGVLIEVALIGYLAFKNSARARIKGLSPWLWAVATVISFFSAMVLGWMVVVFNFLADVINIEQLRSTDASVRLAANEQLQNAVYNNRLHVITILAFAYGGYLLVRFILERKPNKKQPEVHWMDRLGENR